MSEILMLSLSDNHIGRDGLRIRNGKLALRKSSVNAVCSDSSGCLVNGSLVDESFEDVVKMLGWSEESNRRLTNG